MQHPVSVTTSGPARGNGEDDVFARLLPLVNQELSRLEQRYVAREHGRKAGKPSALVTGSLANRSGKRAITGGAIGNRFIDQKHFFTVCARQMRSILVAHAKANDAEYSGAPAADTQPESGTVPATTLSPVLALDRALSDFEHIDPAASLAFELYYFGGHDYKELAIITKVSEVSAQRQLRLARAWLLARMQPS